MLKRKLATFIILLMMTAFMAVFIFYTSYVKSQQQVNKGTLVHAFSEVKEVRSL